MTIQAFKNWFTQKPNVRTLLWVTFFGLAFGLVEGAVVIYIRELYYPEGLGFPLKAISSRVLSTELWRELATIIMLIAVGVIAGIDKEERFAYFLISFAFWDIFYYIFLKLVLNWPESLLTWDILFLLPITWFGPVIATIILSVLMITLGVLMLVFDSWPSKLEWSLLITDALVSILSFTLDYILYIQNGGHISESIALSLTYVPDQFDWEFSLPRWS